MKPKRGCGCVALVLALGNFLVVISLLYGIGSGTVANVGTSLLMLVLFGANIAVCLMLGLPAIRGARGVTTGEGMEGAENEVSHAEEGEES